METLVKNWWLLALCGLVNGMISVIYFSHSGHGFHASKDIVLVGRLTLAAGACTIAAGIWSFRKRKSWLLVLNGLACGALGAILTFWTGPLAFRTVALLIVAMAMSIGVYELATARALRRHLASEWLVGAAGVASIGFALAFLGFVFRWIRLDPGSPAQSLHWLGSYFGFSAICMLGLAVYQHRLGSVSLRSVL